MIIDLKNKDMSLSEAIFMAKRGDTILLDNKEYFEKIELDKPDITIIGDNSIINYNSPARSINPNTNKNYGTSGSATFRLGQNGNNFKCYNVTFINSHKKDSDDGNQAVAFKSEASNILINNCKFISSQDTLYLDIGINNLIIDSYIEGDVDFIFGSSDCLFKNCEIVSKSDYKHAFFLAPSTLAINTHGFVFKDCDFEAKIHTILCRRWFPTSQVSPVIPRFSIIDSNLIGDIDLSVIKMKDKDLEIDKHSIINSRLNEKLISDIGNCDIEYINKVLEYHKNNICL